MKQNFLFLSGIFLVLISMLSCIEPNKDTVCSNPLALYWICDNDTDFNVPDPYRRIGREELESICDTAFVTPGNYQYSNVIDADSPTVPYIRNAQFIMNCMLSAPLIIDCDRTEMTIGFKELVTNPELLALHRNKAGNKAYLAKVFDNGVQVFVRDAGEKRDASRYVAIYNPTDSYQECVLNYSDIDLECMSHISGRNLRLRQDLSEYASNVYLECSLHPKDVIIYRITGDRRLERKKYLHDSGINEGKYVLWTDIYSKYGGDYYLKVFVTPEGIDKLNKKLDTAVCDMDLWYRTNLSYTIKVNNSKGSQSASYDSVIGYLLFKVTLNPGGNTIRIEKNDYTDYIDYFSFEKLSFD